MQHDPIQSAERLVLGAMIRSPDMALALVEKIRPDMFTTPFHAGVCSALKGLVDEGKSVTIPLIQVRVGDVEDGVSVPTMLAVMAGEAEDMGGVSDYLDLISENWRKRAARKALEDAEKALGASAAAVDEILSKLGDQITDIQRTAPEAQEKPLAGILDRVVRQTYTATKQEFIPGMDTGLLPLDEILGRIMPGDVGAICGSPGDGKTALGVQIALRVADHKKAAVFELEMSDDALARRMLAGEALVSASEIEEGTLDFGAMDRLRSAAERLGRKHLVIIDQPKLTMGQIASRCRAIKRTGGLDLVIVDHLRLVKASSRKADKWERMEEACEESKAIAKELGIAFVWLCQRTKESQKRDDPTPRLTDMDGGGALEQYADWVVSVFRRDRWIRATKLNGNPNSQMGETNSAQGKAVSEYYTHLGKAELTVLKRRRGQDGEKRIVIFDGKASRFKSLDAKG